MKVSRVLTSEFRVKPNVLTIASCIEDPTRIELDLFWSFFKSALLSYRASKILKPLPRLIIDDTTSNISSDETLNRLKEFAETFEACKLNRDALTPELNDLLYSIFSCQNCALRLTNLVDDVQFVKQTVGSRFTSEHPPDFVFKADYTSNSVRVQQFHNVKKQAGSSFYAFHGSKLENFYSIINNGLMVRGNLEDNLCARRLLNPVEKLPLYGEGIYLSSEMSVALTFSRRGKTWSPDCSLGSDILCVAIVEVADVNEVKKRQSFQECAAVGNTVNNGFADLLKNKIPDEYVLVTDPTSVLLRYVLVFCERSPARVICDGSRQSVMTRNISITGNALRKFYQLIRTYPVAAMVLSYGIILLLISNFNSRLKGPGFD